MRRLPVYLLIDCSESMAGDAITAVQDGVISLLSQLRTDPQALEMAYLSVITFANSANQVAPLNELCQFKMPDLTMGSGTALGAALSLWEDCMKKDIVKSTPEVKGDYKPICFILTDGEPTDKWEPVADRIKSMISGKKAFVVAIACGADASTSKLKRITEDVLLAKDVNSDSLKKIFKWVSASVATASQTVEKSGREGINLDKLPTDCLEKADETGKAQEPVPDRFIFMHAKCTKSRQFYVMRYMKQAGSGLFGLGKNTIYKGVASHKVDKFDFSVSSGQSLKISTSQLGAPPPCPYCGNKVGAMCQCGHIICSPQINGVVELVCPWCEKKGSYAFGSTFDVGRGRG